MLNIRKRWRALSGIRGTSTHIPTNTVSYGGLAQREYVEDVVGNRQAANYFYHESRVYEVPGTISGQADAFPVFRYKGYPYFSQSGFYHLDASTAMPSVEEAVTSVAARTNPSKPAVSIPLFLAELRDFPASLRKYGRDKSRRGSNQGGSSVDFNFGWDQLYRDVSNMFNYTKQVDDRVKQLTAAHGVGGANGTRHVWDDTSYEVQSNLEVWSLEGSVIVDVHRTTVRSMWASVRWKADDPGLPPADQILADARRIVHGWRISPADVWELIPWSWFIDYFVNVGDYLEATTNSVGIHPEFGCAMLHTTTTVEHKIVSATSWIGVTPSCYRFETKERWPVTPSLTLRSVPFLGPKQLVTLSSIISSFG